MFKNCLDFGLKKSDLIALFAIVACYIYIKVTGTTEIYENSLLENMQLMPLILGSIICFRAKNHKIFFRFIALVLVLAFLRELSYGRVIFCAMPDNPHEFYKWSHYKYGWLAHVFIGLYIGLTVLWALLSKIWVDVIDIMKNVKIPVITFIIAFGAIFAQLYSEKYLHSTIIEETAELVIYCTTLSLIIIYFNKLKRDEEEKERLLSLHKSPVANTAFSNT